ncbi:MAG TPA: hypothetical protein P5057_12920, partial [Acidobacteriota bacterium]|nr:hypothetical protein [Acidobacteriota bacterium]
LPGMGPNVKDDNYTGLYYFDRFGNLELLYADPEFSCMYPIPLEPRPTPPVVSSSLESALGEEGEFILTDVKQSFFPLPESRPIRRLRIFQVLPKTSTHVANQPRIGYANAEIARMLLGTVPVEEDGSAYFRAPARKPLYFQAVDGDGRAVQSMRSITYLQPGERRSCVGCHEPPGTASPARPDLMALRREPSTIEPGPEGTRPMSYPLLVQPVLDRHCVRCHDGSQGEWKAPPVLTGEPEGAFTQSYASLKPFVRWYEWGDKSIREIGTEPGRSGADESRLLKSSVARPMFNMWTCRKTTINVYASGWTPTPLFTAPMKRRPNSPSRRAKPWPLRPYSEKPEVATEVKLYRFSGNLTSPMSAGCASVLT